MLNFTAPESKRFGLKIFRGMLDTIDLKYLNRTISENFVDVAIFRIPTKNNAEITKLSKLGFPYLQADTLVYYYADFNTYSIKPLQNSDLNFVPFSKENIPIIEQLVDEIFVGYTNHYDSNPYFDKTNIMDGYKEWMLSFIGNSDKIGWIVVKDNKNIGFASCSITDSVAEGVLYGVVPWAAGGGVYTDIIRFTQQYMKNKGIGTMKVSTQIQNHAVQKVWGREGFVLKESYATIHINSLLSRSIVTEKEIEITITKELIDDFGNISGDLNPIHFDTAFAQKTGLTDRIAHGLIPNSLISKYYGTEFPGYGTLFLSYSYKFYQPLYINCTYRIVISFPYAIESKGIYLSVVKIFDENNTLCLVSYNDLIRK